MKAEFLPRNKLFKKLTDRLIAVSAPSGFGKTSLIREWCRSQAFPTGWLSVTDTHRDSTRFMLDVRKVMERLNRHKTEKENKAPTLVIDNCHLLSSQLVKRLPEFIPPTVKLILISRHQLPFDAPQLTADDLRFNKEESRAFFEKRIGRLLSEKECSDLYSWTHGWAAGMQLLALVVREYGGVNEWAGHFDGSHRVFADYFFEVFSGLPNLVKEFLLQTSVLDTFDQSFCATLQTNLLPDVLRRCLFVAENNGNYKYEPLFLAFLRKESEKVSDAKRKRWYRKGAEWCAANGKEPEAVDLAILEGNAKRAASLLIRFAPEFLRKAEWKVYERWNHLIFKLKGQQRAEVLLFFCWVYFLKGAFARLGELLWETEKVVAADHLPDQFRGELSLLQSFSCFVTKDWERAIRQCDTAFSFLHDGGVYFDARIPLNVDEAQMTRGKVGLKGRIDKAIRYYLHFNQYRSLIPETLAGYGFAAFAEASYEANQIEAAREAAQEAIAVAKKIDSISMLVPATITLTQILQKEKAFQKAVSLIETTIEMAKEKGRLWRLLLVAQEIRLFLKQGNLKGAQRLVYENILHADQNAEQLHEFESLSYARVLIAAEDYDQAEFYLEQLLLAAESRDRYGTRIEIMVLRTVLFHKTNRMTKGLEELRNVVKMAEAEGYARTLLDEGEPIFDLLQRIGSQSLYVKHLLDFFREELESPQSGPALTRRELDVLHMMAAGMANKEMASAINVTLGTVKGYGSSLFKKLQVHNRTEAVARGRELDLL